MALRQDHDEARRNLVRNSVRVKAKPVPPVNRGLTKLESREQFAEAKIEGAAIQLKQFERMCADLRVDHYDRMFPKFKSVIEDAEFQRCRKVIGCLAGWNTCRLEHTKALLERETKLHHRIAGCDARGDLTEFRAQNRPMADRAMPATSLTTSATIRGHLEFCVLSVSKKDANARLLPGMWKDFLFVLSADTRKLFQYDSEDSIEPRCIHVLLQSELAVIPVDETLFDRKDVFQVTTETNGVFYLHLAGRDKAGWIPKLKACVETAPTGDAASAPATHTAALPREIRRIDVTVIEAKSLAKQGDYFGYVHLGTQPMARTHILRGTAAPYWGKRFTFDKIPRSFRVSVRLPGCTVIGGCLLGHIGPALDR